MPDDHFWKLGPPDWLPRPGPAFEAVTVTAEEYGAFWAWIEAWNAAARGQS